MRGGLDDALDKLARRDELRRRAAGETTGTPPAVTELVEAIAAVVGRNPGLGVTVGVEGAGDPMVLRFVVEDGMVQVTADNSLARAATEGAPRHADFDVEVGEPVEEPYPATPRLSHDDQDRYGPSNYGYEQPQETGYYTESDTAERRYGSFDRPPQPEVRYDTGETSRDLGARMRDLGMAARSAPQQPEYPPPHPFAATPPPPVPPQQQQFQQPQFPPQQFVQEQYQPDNHAQTTRRIEHEHYSPPAEPAATERLVPPPQRGMPAPLPQPIPLQVERPEETEIAARRLAALLRDDPSLLNNSPE